jgi:hypothetical protein
MQLEDLEILRGVTETQGWPKSLGETLSNFKRAMAARGETSEEPWKLYG